MGTCLSKKKPSSTSSPPKSLSTPPPTQPKNPENNNVTETTLNNKPNTEPPKEDESQPKKEIFIIKHRKSHDEREKNSKITPFTVQHNVPSQQNEGLVSSSETESTSMNNNNNNNNDNKVVNVVGVRTSSCTKEEVDAILIQCGRLSRSSSGKAASSSANGRKYSGSKRSFDFDNCDNNNDAISAEDEQKRTNVSETSEEHDGGRNRNSHRQRNRGSPKPGRRRTPSREREQQRSSSRERRVSRSPGRRSSDNNNGGSVSVSVTVSGSGCSRPGKMVTVPATVTSLVMDKSNNGGGGGGGGESVKRGGVKRNVGVASPRSMSPARGNGNQQQPCSLSRNNSSRKAEVSPYRRNPLSEVDPNSHAYPQSNANVNGGNKVQNKSKKEVEVVQKPNVDTRDSMRSRTSSRGTLEKGVNHHQTKEQQEEEIKLVTSDNAIVKNMVMPSGIENFKPQTLTRSRSSRRSSRDFDINPEPLPPQQNSSYTSLLLEDIQNFHQKTHPSVSLPPCLNKACSILEAVADLNSTTSSNNFSSGAFLEDKKTSSIRNEYNVEEPFVESEVVIFDDVMEPSLHKYVTVKRGGSLCEDQESSGSNSFTVSSGQKQYGICSSSWEQNSCDSSDCWSSRLNSKDESLKSPLGLDGSLGSSCEANKKTLNGKRRECDHQHSGGIGRGRLAADAAALT